MRLNDRGRLDLGAEKKIVDVASMRYRARKRRKWQTAVHSGYVRTREGDQHRIGKRKRERIPGQARWWCCECMRVPAGWCMDRCKVQDKKIERDGKRQQ
jgi:hypothetical protein